MNNSEGEYQAVSEVSTSQNAMQLNCKFDEEDTGVKSPEVHGRNDTRSWSMADYRVFMASGKWSKADCRNAAMVMGQLRYWTPKATVTRDGHKWIKKSVTDWDEELAGMTRREVERVNAILLDAEFACIAQYPWGLLKSPSNHYRLTEKALAVKPHVQNVLMENPKHVQSVQAKGEPLVQNVQVTENTYNPTENKKIKPVDASPEATQSTVSDKSNTTTGKDKSKTKPSLTAVGKTPKFLSWGKTFDDAVTACHGAPKVVLPEDQQKIRHRNMRFMCLRMLDAQYTPEQVHAFLRWAGGEGWMTLRNEWGPVYHPDIHAKEQVPFTPDIGWLVGSPTHGTGAHRLEAALGVWGFFGGPTPNAHAHPQPVVTPEPEPPFLTYFDLHPDELAELQAKKADAEATQSPAMPSAEVVVSKGKPDAVEPVTEAMVGPQVVQVDEFGYSWQETLDAMKHAAMLEARQQAALAAAAAKTKATMFQGLKHAEAQAA